MTKRKVGIFVLALVGVTIGMVSVIALREATLSTHDEVIAPDSQIEVVMKANIKGEEENQTIEELVTAQVTYCRLEVESDLVGPIERREDGKFVAVLSPAMDQSNRRQFRGCLEDWGLDHLKVDVTSLVEV
ncbi:MAG TPA: hypothetical protein VFX21_17190 [Acidimicrobiia bacterium]|nr:hypothetical protein [Acidimicrobiia bacterium]